MKTFALAAVVVLVSAFGAFGATLYVSKAGNDVSGNGSSGSPYATIQKGIEESSPGDVVEVSQGTYTETINFLGRAITVKSTDPDDPDVVEATIVNGDGAGSVVTMDSGETSASVLTGFTITNGSATQGGGIYCGTASPTITRNIITGNVATGGGYYDGGGGIYAEGGPSITHNTITGNSSKLGGGIKCAIDSAVTISNNVISGNTISSGGAGIFVQNADATITDNVIDGNIGEDWIGGGILCQSGGNTTITRNTITNNAAAGGGGIAFSEGSRGTASYNIITGNKSLHGDPNCGGGGIECRQFGSPVTLKNNVIVGNMAAGEGGGGVICMSNGTVTIENCTIADNKLLSNPGGGITAEWGAAVTIKNCIIYGNTAVPATGKQLAVWGSQASLTVRYSDVQSGSANVYNDGSTLTWQTGNLNVDPLFASNGNWEDSGTPGAYLDDSWSGGDYHLMSAYGRWDPAANGGNGAWVTTDASSSPCIDTGDPTSAWANEPEANGERINMGAEGNTAFASKSTSANVTMAVSPEGAATTTPDGVTTLPLNKARPIVATPTGLSTFANWTASPSGNATFGNANAASTTVTVTGDVTITANMVGVLSPPEFQPAAGSYRTTTNVTVTCATEGTTIHYTTNGSTPTAASTTYGSPIAVTESATLKAIAMKTDWQDSDVATAAYNIDAHAPSVTGVASLPTSVRETVDHSITVTATATDATTGASTIAAAESYVGTDPGEGNGTAMTAADGQFNSATESLTGQVNTTSWTVGSRTVYVRARDAAGNWSAPASVVVPVVDGTPPGTVVNLTASAATSFTKTPATINVSSSHEAGLPAGLMLDENPNTYWLTEGTVDPREESVIFDLGSIKSIGSVILVPGPAKNLFPATFKIEISEGGVTWTQVAAAKSFKAVKGNYAWLFDETDARYLKISGPSVRDPKDARYYWEIADAYVCKCGGSSANLSWTAPADNGYTGIAASQYDIRYSTSSITAGNFAAATQVTGVSAPKTPGTAEHLTIAAGTVTGTLYVALKTADAIPNWSPMSNVAQVGVQPIGILSTSPADGASVTTSTIPSFSFLVDSGIKPATIVFSSCSAFVAKPTARGNGETDKSIRFTLKSGTSVFIPTAAQWVSLKKLVCSDATLWWRVEGPSGDTMMFGPTRSMFFDTGTITGLTASPSHNADGNQGLWPDKDIPPSFSWTNATVGMATFFVDVSTDDSVSLSDKKHTFTLCPRGTTGTSYTVSAAEWKKLRQLATAGSGVLYWRVRAQDADKAMTAVTDPETLVVDGGTWTLSDLTIPAGGIGVTWTHTGAGIAAYYLQFSTDAGFPALSKQTVRIPAKSVTGLSYILSAVDVQKLQTLASRNGVTTLHYRICGEDAEKAFIARSDAASAGF